MSTSSKDSTQRGDTRSEQKDPSSPSGRIVHDSRGNAVWSWGKSSEDPAATNSTSNMLKKLDVGNLRMEDDARPETQQPPETKKRGSGYGPGYNPYDRTAPVRVAPPKKESSR